MVTPLDIREPFGLDIKTTVTPLHTNAIVSISPLDADANTAGHQVSLAEGDNTIALAVIAANSKAQTYTIIVRRPAPASPSQAQQRFQAGSVATESKKGRLLAASAFSGGVRFVFEVSVDAWDRAELEVEASSSLGESAKWRLLEEGEDYRLAWEEKQDSTAQVTLTLPHHPNPNQSFLRLEPTN